MRFHAQLQRLQALQDHPGVEGATASARRCAGRCTPPSISCLAAQHRAAQHPALAVEILGGGVDHDVGAQLQRPLQRRRAEAVVHRQPGAGLRARLRQRGDVAHFGQRVGRRFDEQQLGVRLHRRLPGRQIGRRHEGGLDAEALRGCCRTAAPWRRTSLREATMWSPALSSPITVARIADMPEAVATQLSAPSSAASRSWNA